MTRKFKTILSIVALSFLTVSANAWAQDDADSDDKSDKKKTPRRLPFTTNSPSVRTISAAIPTATENTAA